MAENIKWATDINDAIKRAQDQKKFILLDFFNPG
jgi:hypothetical protein